MRGQPKRDWTEARAKCAEEGGCRVCGAWPVEAAHVTGRKHDQPKHYGGVTLRVRRQSVVPLCPFHHGAYDRHEFDLLPYLTVTEQVQAVKDLDGIELARKRTAPLQYVNGVAA